MVQAEASERDDSIGVLAKLTGKPDDGVLSDLLGSQLRPVALADWVSHLPLAHDTSRSQESRGSWERVREPLPPVGTLQRPLLTKPTSIGAFGARGHKFKTGTGGERRKAWA